MPGVSFDRAAAFYDATRALPDGVPEAARDAIVRHVGAGPDTRFLEIGIGTGRVALPFILAGWLDAEHPAPDAPASDEGAVVALIGTLPA